MCAKLINDAVFCSSVLRLNSDEKDLRFSFIKSGATDFDVFPAV